MGYTTIGIALLGLAVMAAVSSAREESTGIRVPKQIHHKAAVSDQNSAETGFGGGGGVEQSKYFHYQHLPEHDKYEFGYRRGNDHHVKERYEKAHPHEGHFKTKVRWADKKGGHGEHYWDYNHAGHGGDDGEGGYSDPVPAYTPSAVRTQKRELEAESQTVSRRSFIGDDQKVQASRRYTDERPVRQYYEEPRPQSFYSGKEPQVFDPQEPAQSVLKPQESRRPEEGFVGTFKDEIGDVQNFEIQRAKQKRTPEEGQRASKRVEGPAAVLSAAARAGRELQDNGQPQLYFDLESGKVIDEKTGKTYLLQPYTP